MLVKQASIGQQIFGAKGPDGAIMAHEPRRASAESPLAQYHLEVELGFHGDRKELREEAEAEYARAAGSLEALMDCELFIATVGQLWCLDRVCAKACFTAGDADKSVRINHHEWLILREAFVWRSAEHESHPAIKNLQLRATLYSYDEDHNGQLSTEESDITRGAFVINNNSVLIVIAPINGALVIQPMRSIDWRHSLYNFECNGRGRGSHQRPDAWPADACQVHSISASR